MVGTGQPKAQTQGQKFKQYVMNTVGPFPLVTRAATAGIAQWANSPEAWGQGWEAYGRRYGSDLARNGIRQTVMYGLSVPLREDNRYYVLGTGGFWKRMRHALISPVTAHMPGGHMSFSVSSTCGIAASSISAAQWGPPSWQTTSHIVGSAGVTIGSIAAFSVVREFLPDLLHRPR